MDFSFESDPKSSMREESDFDTQLITEQDNSRLKEENVKLHKELQIMRAQFEQAIDVTKKMDNVHQKNQKLTKCIRLLQLENDELKKKIEITQHSNEEILDKLNQEKYNFSAQLQRENSIKEKEISKYKNNLEIEKEKLHTQIAELSEIVEQKELQNKLNQNKVDRLLHAANQFFYQEFPDIELLVNFLTTQPNIPSKEIQIVKPECNPISDEDALCKLENKLKKSRNQIKNLNTIKEELESEISNLKHDILKKDNKLSEINQNIERDINQIQEEHLIKVTDLESQNQQLIAKVTSLKDEISQMKIIIKEFKTKEIQQQPSIPQTQILIPKVQQIDNTGFIEEIECLKGKNTELSQNLIESERKIEKLESKLRKSETKINSLELNLSNMTNKYGALEIVHKETLIEIESLRKSFNSQKENRKPTNETKRVFSNMKSQINHLEDKIKVLTKDLHEVSVEREQFKRNNEQQQNKIHQLKDELDESQSRVIFLKEELHSTKDQLLEKPKVTIESFIPSYSWRFNEFDRELCNELEKIIINPLLQPASKLNNIYKTINNYFNELIKKKDNGQIEMVNELNSLKTIFSQFIVDLCISLQIPSIELNDFIDRHGSEIILNKLKSLSQCYDDEKRQCFTFSQFIDHLTSELSDITTIPSNCNLNDLYSLISQIKNQFVNLPNTIKTKNKQIKELKNAVLVLKTNSKNDISILQTELETVSNSYDILQSQHEQIVKEYNDIRRQLQSSKNEFRDLKTTSEEKEKSLRDEFENVISTTKQEHEMILKDLRSQLSVLSKEKESINQTNTNNLNSIERLKTVIEQERKTIEEKNSTIRQIKTKSESEINKIIENNKIEKEQLIQNYEKAVAEISKQCDMHRSDLEKVSVELSNSEKSIEQNKSVILKLKREKMKLETELNSLKEQNKRDKQIAQANVKSQVLHAEEVYNQKILDVQSKCESDKRRIFTFAADEFRMYFDPSEKMDERCFRSFLMKIKKELEKLKESDSIIRRLVGAGPEQTTDDAVAQYLSL